MILGVSPSISERLNDKSQVSESNAEVDESLDTTFQSTTKNIIEAILPIAFNEVSKSKKIEGANDMSEQLPLNRPSRLTSVRVNKASFKQISAETTIADGEKLTRDLAALREEIAPIAAKRFVMFKNKAVWFDREVAGLFPKFESGVLPSIGTNSHLASNYAGLDFEGFHFDTMTMNECLQSFRQGSGNPYLSGDNYMHFDNVTWNNCILTEETNGSNSLVVWSNGNSNWYNNSSYIVKLVPICRLRGKNAAAMNYAEAFSTWLELGLIPDGLTAGQERRFVEMFVVKALKTELLDCDHKRADLQPYDERQLIDINRGHWELFDLAMSKGDDMIEIQLPSEISLAARPPQLDVRLHGVCAIDFGTKSTIVVCRDGDARILRIGKGDYAEAPTMKDFENPTVIELRDINSFLAAYRKRIGRPFTEWDQVTVSHQAADAIFKDNSRGSSIYNSVFGELKRWAKDDQNYPILKDLRGTEQVIKPYVETKSIDEGDFDPIELYAYYLGLYINNMHRQIYLDYILSYPVNYRKEVREKIRASFERGLRKSLPPSLQSDDEMMKRFRVYLGASEPAAYAITALEQYGLEPRDIGDKTAYGVFDFGGGTTDFDFGIELVPKKHARNFHIEQFGSSGDVLLGGENIIELLAYEVYKDNIDEMRAKKIPFALPTGCKTFAGAETLVEQTRDAASHMNNRILAEKLRPIWEGGDGEELIGDAQQLNMFSNAKGDQGTGLVGVQLKIDAEKLNRVIEDRIRLGVENFFQSMAAAFRGKDTRPIHIFLAGNSCRSPIVKKLFDEYIAREEAGQYVLHLPLGMDEYKFDDSDTDADADSDSDADADSDSDADADADADADSDMELDQQRTGKTGVAFGLIRCRKGGKDVKIINRNVDKSDQMLFPYFLGDAGYNGKIFRVTIATDIEYGVWKYFTAADEPDFEVYYTSAPRALQSKMPIAEVSMVHCVIDDNEVSDDEEVGIYIRKVDPNTIEYAVGSADDFTGEFKGKTHSQKL